MHAAKTVKDSEIKALNNENKNLVAENKTLRSDLKEAQRIYMCPRLNLKTLSTSWKEK